MRRSLVLGTRRGVGALIYLHPRPGRAVCGAWRVPRLRAHLGMTFETGSHALRLIFGGVFDRFPARQARVGALGETLPSCSGLVAAPAGFSMAVKLASAVAYIKETSCDDSGIAPRAAQLHDRRRSAMKKSAMMFAADYPFESPRKLGIHRWRGAERACVRHSATTRRRF